MEFYIKAAYACLLCVMIRDEEGKRLIEGYWGPGFQTPASNSSPWHDQDLFLGKLRLVEGVLPQRGYKGSAPCRFMDKCGLSKNGSREFEDKYWKEGWTVVWPEGFRHYIEVHNLKPTQEFLTYVDEAVANVGAHQLRQEAAAKAAAEEEADKRRASSRVRARPAAASTPASTKSKKQKDGGEK